MPAQPQDSNLQFIAIKDFSPGISDNPGSNYSPGSAQTSGTFRCISNRNGALIPLPQRTIPFSMPNDGTPTDGQYGLDGLYVPPIGLLPTVLAFNPDFFPEHELWVGNEWLQGGLRHQRLRRYRRYETPGTANDLIMDVSAADAATTLTPNGMFMGSTRSNRTTPTQPGVPVVIANWGTGAAFQYTIEFPDDQNTASNTPYTIFSNTRFFIGMCEHQGRTVAQEATAYGHGVNTQTFMGENLTWSNVNDVTGANWQTPSQVFVPENPSGFAFIASMSANELFGVKLYGGMYASGDLFDPTVVSLPMVMGSEVQQTPVAMESGLIYGNGSSGIWQWQHGDTSQLLSPAMNPGFWLIDKPSPNDEFDVFGGIRYQFSRCDDWVLIPNNWLYDTSLKSWWRIEDPTVTQIRMWTAVSRVFYGSQGFYTNAASNAVHMWERGVPALSYSWQSQPLWETVGNLIDIREFTMRAVGSGQVRVTATGETSTQSVTFEVNSTLPVLLRQYFRLQDANIAVKIEASGGVAAPTIYELNVGYLEAQKGPAHN